MLQLFSRFNIRTGAHLGLFGFRVLRNALSRGRWRLVSRNKTMLSAEKDGGKSGATDGGREKRDKGENMLVENHKKVRIEMETQRR